MIKKLLLLKNIIKASSEKKMLELLIKEAAEMTGYTSKIIPGGISATLAESILPLVKKYMIQFLTPKIGMRTAKVFVEEEYRDILDYYFEISKDKKYLFLDAYIIMTMVEGESKKGIDIDAPPPSTDVVGPLKMSPTEKGVGDLDLPDGIDVDSPSSGGVSGPLGMSPRKSRGEDLDLPKVSSELSESIIKYLVSLYIKETNVLSRAKKFARLSPKDRDFLKWMNKKTKEIYDLE